MPKGLAPILFTTCGVVVAGIIGYAFLKPNHEAMREQLTSTSKVVENEPATLKDKNDQVLLSPLPKPDEDIELRIPQVEEAVIPKTLKNENIQAALSEPSLDIVRVERDGSMVIAGASEPNKKVELIVSGDVLAETVAAASGDFVFALDEPLGAGSHEIFLRVVGDNGEAIKSSAFALVDVPKSNELGNVTVLIAEVGKPSQILQKPKTPNVVVSNTAKETVTLAPSKEVDVSDNEVLDKKLDAPKETVSEDTKEVQRETISVLIEAADIEADKVFIAGKGEPKSTITLYLDNDVLGSTTVDDNGAFLFEGSNEVKAGQYEVRADMRKAGSASVIARAEVKLIHEPKAIALNKPTLDAVTPQTKINTEAEPLEKNSVKQDFDESVAEEVEKKEIRTGSAVIVRTGDSLWTVARRNYGAGIRYTTIFDANRDQVRNPHRIYPGQVLKVPEGEEGIE